MAGRPPKRPRVEPAQDADDGGLGGLYDFLPPPDPGKDAAAKAAAAKVPSRPTLPPEDNSRVIFLDVDGVIVPSGAVEMIFIDGVQIPKQDRVKESDFSVAAMGNLRAIVQQTGASVVLSSEWRRTEKLRDNIGAAMRSYDLPKLRDWTPIFEAKPELQGVDPVLAWCERRAREIGKWLRDHPEVTAWVALDDLDFSMADSVRVAGTPWVKYRSVLTHHRHCLTDDDAKEAVRLLLSPPPEPTVRPRRPTGVPMSEGKASGVLCSTEDSSPERIRLG